MNRPLHPEVTSGTVTPIRARTSLNANIQRPAAPRTGTRSRPLMRKYEVTSLAANGDLQDFTRLAPALPAFESAFAAFARGTLINTPRGPVAVEDLWPGDIVTTENAGPQTLLWKGATTLLPNVPGQHPDMGALTRISAGSLGPNRPFPDLMLGPVARLFEPAPAEDFEIGATGILRPVRERIDGDAIFEIVPPSAVRVFHLCFAGHCRIMANGIEVESFHPGRYEALGLSGDLLQLYLSMFPHVTSIRDFGPMVARRVGSVLETTEAA